MVKSKLYEGADRELYTMEDMVNRVIYWWIRYKGTRTEDGKEFRKFDLIELIHRLKVLHDEPELFRFNNPNMKSKEDDEDGLD